MNIINAIMSCSFHGGCLKINAEIQRKADVRQIMYIIEV